jgi:hypothetical protein
MQFLVERLDLDAQSLKDLGYQLREQHPDLAFIAGSVIDGKPLLAVSLGKGFMDGTGLKAGGHHQADQPPDQRRWRWPTRLRHSRRQGARRHGRCLEEGGAEEGGGRK